LETEKYLKGPLITTIFHNEKNLYSVIKIKVEETNEEFNEKEAVITGYFPRMVEEETYKFFGQFKEHPRFGLQYHATHYRKEIPSTEQGVIAYLSSDLFKGIGKKTAQAIVNTLGTNAISKILEKPSVLDDVPNLSKEKAKLIYDQLSVHQGLEKILITLNQLGFGPQLSMKIYQTYHEDTLTIIQDNPYQLIEDVEGIGFAKADELGRKIGKSGNHPDRIKAGCLYTLENESLQNGHVYLKHVQLVEKTKELLESSEPTEIFMEEIDHQLTALEEEGKIIFEDERIYLPSLFYSEIGLVSSIKKIMSQTEYEQQFPESEFLLALGELEERLSIQYAPSQKEAIQKALMNPMLILTGGPGTGKTTVIKGIVELYGELHGISIDVNDYKKDEPFPILLVAPTGRAAKRMNESTGLPAVTIHRLLGWNGAEGFQYDEESPIEGKLLIIDESSMVDIWLANQLFKALPATIQVIIVGDEDQLPSVGPGQVLKDLIDSNVIPTVKLTDIYRQESGSSIIDLAHHIKNGKVPSTLTVQQKDRSFIPCQSNQIKEVIKQIVQLAIKKGYRGKDIQVLAPMYRGVAGIDKLNEMLQEVLNPNPEGNKRELKFGDITFRIGDKVLQLVNLPEKNVFNGDMGEVVSIFYAKENEEKQDQVIVSFDGNEVTYTRQDLNQMTLAYCCSIHKSQGSEFPIVILPVFKSYYRMLRRNLIYTAVTRSKQFLIICGEAEAFHMAVSRIDDTKRQTTLKERLELAITDQKIIKESENSYYDQLMQTDPMIGMENVTPYDFLS